MGRIISLTVRSLYTAARHTDARSLAVRVPRGTMIPTYQQITNKTLHKTSDKPLEREYAAIFAALHVPRTKVYAFFLGLRIVL